MVTDRTADATSPFRSQDSASSALVQHDRDPHRSFDLANDVREGRGETFSCRRARPRCRPRFPYPIGIAVGEGRSAVSI